MPLRPINVQSLFFSFRPFFVFHLIRTQAFSVFSEVSGGGTATRQNKTQMSESERDGIWTTSCLFFFFFYCFFSSLLFLITSSLWGGFGLKHRCVREQLSSLIILKTTRSTAAVCFWVTARWDRKVSFHLFATALTWWGCFFWLIHDRGKLFTVFKTWKLPSCDAFTDSIITKKFLCLSESASSWASFPSFFLFFSFLFVLSFVGAYYLLVEI